MRGDAQPPPPRFIAHVNQPPREVYGCDAGAVGSFFCSTAAAGRTRPGPPAVGTGKSHFGKLCRKARRGGRPSLFACEFPRGGRGRLKGGLALGCSGCAAASPLRARFPPGEVLHLAAITWKTLDGCVGCCPVSDHRPGWVPQGRPGHGGAAVPLPITAPGCGTKRGIVAPAPAAVVPERIPRFLRSRVVGGPQPCSHDGAMNPPTPPRRLRAGRAVPLTSPSSSLTEAVAESGAGGRRRLGPEARRKPAACERGRRTGPAVWGRGRLSVRPTPWHAASPSRGVRRRGAAAPGMGSSAAGSGSGAAPQKLGAEPPHSPRGRVPVPPRGPVGTFPAG